MVNGGFEDYIYCPQKPKFRYQDKSAFPVKYWNRIEEYNSTTYYNSNYEGCFSAEAFRPGRYDNAPRITAKTGSAFIGMYPCGLNFKSTLKLGYIEPTLGKLQTSLYKDSLYNVQISINLPATSTYNVSSFSVVFLPDTFKNPTVHSLDFHELWGYLNGKEAGIVEFDISSTIHNRAQWLTFNTTYKATGNERYLLIGFYPQFTEKQKKEYMSLIEDGKERKLYKKLRKYYTLYKKPEDKPIGNFKDSYFFVDGVSVEMIKTEDAVPK